MTKELPSRCLGPKARFPTGTCSSCGLEMSRCITPALYPYKIYPSEGKEGNTAPVSISLPGFMAVPGPEHQLDILKVVAVAALCLSMEEII